MDQDIYIRHEYKIEKGCLGDRHYENFLTRIEAKYHLLDDDDQEVEVGRASFFQIDIDSLMRVQSEEGRVDIHDILDLDGNTEPFTMLYDLGRGCFRKKVCNIVGVWGDYSGSLFVINRLELLPKYRMKGKAAEAIAEAVRLFSGNAEVVAITAFPLQLMDKSGTNPSDWEKKMQYDKFEQDSKIATKGLVKYYLGLGFKVFNKEHSIMIASKCFLLEKFYGPENEPLV